ncbi:hypothetical protein CCMSSC00406_0009330 [Pleurotus cornucopiae]|uniref:Uncharacterized protein n=1 Tax=Pleurotus cornucopiae TaxID=5321 RepID=A0ACB7J8N4_PLECO|nr:hypothetical protein CCMSSC00406_0009330 [Pleurotus cornucopiae]
MVCIAGWNAFLAASALPSLGMVSAVAVPAVSHTSQSKGDCNTLLTSATQNHQCPPTFITETITRTFPVTVSTPPQATMTVTTLLPHAVRGVVDGITEGAGSNDGDSARSTNLAPNAKEQWGGAELQARLMPPPPQAAKPKPTHRPTHRPTHKPKPGPNYAVPVQPVPLPAAPH